MTIAGARPQYGVTLRNRDVIAGQSAQPSSGAMKMFFPVAEPRAARHPPSRPGNRTMIGRMLCHVGRHARDAWLPPARGTMIWQSTCHRCGCRMMRDPVSGRWRSDGD